MLRPIRSVTMRKTSLEENFEKSGHAVKTHVLSVLLH